MRKLFIVAVLFALLIAVNASLTEDDFKKMKMKDLRIFLSSRGLECVGCLEKSDFVRLAFQNKDKQPLASATKREIPEGKFWEVWEANAKTKCEEAVKKRGGDPASKPFSDVCHTIEKAVEGYFMQNGRQVATKLKKQPLQLLKTSYKDIYYDAGLRLLEKLSNHCLSTPDQQKKCSSMSNVMKLLEDEGFKVYITNVGIENTNPMYDIIDDAADL
ncbi:hypothetical protein AGDE_03517 [Angomonas deanei]|uniref:Degradation arginine-rich protein for mis-folding, putative n=1 Tax=Angomonas deanei TaxID=59799 RepID=S9WF29_9TRYP|nr:hypothetical protein AGDE_06153 [Angomonas deanei]EPY40411.1 hypothetical protein AGDE_03517 [Angomonas deanei]CAD2214529.1 Degradation arginine-rich protein for mis-folding, putative [Angomonas deanei]|eukprot:EPY37781.1 hypothetical protein AGDE_06153 [Angomonas deanei]